MAPVIACDSVVVVRVTFHVSATRGVCRRATSVLSSLFRLIGRVKRYAYLNDAYDKTKTDEFLLRSERCEVSSVAESVGP